MLLLLLLLGVAHAVLVAAAPAGPLVAVVASSYANAAIADGAWTSAASAISLPKINLNSRLRLFKMNMSTLKV